RITDNIYDELSLDCPEVMVGLDCADLCNFKCVDQRCETSGRCVQCHAGFYGEHCDL
ncbi:hypothetical protein Bpfe_028977, partial [Biomphalaria pfeifferi]